MKDKLRSIFLFIFKQCIYLMGIYFSCLFDDWITESKFKSCGRFPNGMMFWNMENKPGIIKSIYHIFLNCTFRRGTRGRRFLLLPLIVRCFSYKVMHSSWDENKLQECNDAALHCVKSVRIWSYSSLYFSAFGLNMDRYSISVCIQSNAGKCGPEKLQIWALELKKISGT